MDLARNLLADLGGLKGLFGSDEGRFCRTKGMGKVKYGQLQAVLALSRRYLEEEIKERDLADQPGSDARLLQDLAVPRPSCTTRPARSSPACFSTTTTA